MPLHLTKVAFGCASIDTLERKVARLSAGGEFRVATRMRPKRADELIGGQLHFIVKHRIVARIQILRLEDRNDGRINIVCADRLEPVTPVPRRAHQGWRYLEDKDAPGQEGDSSGLAELPSRLYGRLAALALV